MKVLKWFRYFVVLAACAGILTPASLQAAPGTKAKAVQVDEDEEYTYVIVLSPEDVLRYGSQLNFENPALLASIAKVESDYQPFVTNHYKGVTYYGLMQISYSTARMVGYTGTRQQLMDWRVNMTYAAKYLEVLLEQHHTLKQAIAAYNAGSVFMCKNHCKKGNFINQGYVDKVMKQYVKINGSAEKKQKTKRT